jgi:hypothetical protein
MLPQCRNLLLLVLTPSRQASLRLGDVVIGVVQPYSCDHHDRAWQLVRTHALEGLVESLFLAIEQVVVCVALPGVPAGLHRHLARLEGHI